MRWLVLAALCGCGRIGFDIELDSTTTDAAPDPTLLAHLEFESDGLLVDRAGNAVTCLGNCPTAAPGRIGAGAAMFDGTQCLAIPDAPAFHTPILSVMLWASVVTPTLQFGELASRPLDGATAQVNSWELWVGPSDNWVAEVSGTATVSQPLPAQTWHHIALVFDGTTMTQYIDGVMTGARTATSLVFATDATVVGCDVDVGAAVYRVTGMLDDVRIYARVVVESEIGELVAM